MFSTLQKCFNPSAYLLFLRCLSAKVAEGFGFLTLQQCSTLFQPSRGQTGAGPGDEKVGRIRAAGAGRQSLPLEIQSPRLIFQSLVLSRQSLGWEQAGRKRGSGLRGARGRRLQKSAVSSVVWAQMRGFVRTSRRLGGVFSRFFPFSRRFCSKAIGFIGDFRPFGQSFPQTAFPAERMNSSERFESQTLQPVLH